VKILLAALLIALLPAAGWAFGEGDQDNADPTDMIAPSGLVVYYDSSGPLSFVSMTPKDVPDGARKIPRVKGVACQRGIAAPSLLVGSTLDLSAYYGDGSYAKALRQIKKDNPEISGIYDVRVDLHMFSILGVYHSQCTEVTARAFVLPSAPPPSPPPAPAPAAKP